jgi:hypothetical protein
MGMAAAGGNSNKGAADTPSQSILAKRGFGEKPFLING